MKLTLIPITAAALFATLPLTAGAAGMDETDMGAEAQMAMAASVTLQQAGDAALVAQPGTLAEIEFSDEAGTAAYEATIYAADGQEWTVLVDASTGAVTDQGLAADMEQADDQDHASNDEGDDDGDHESDDDGDDGETDDDKG